MTVTEQLSALDSILAHGDLHCLFQPILSLSERRLVGYEALTRGPSNSPLHSPLALFAVARQCGRLSELELLCRQRAFSRFRDIQGDAMLFLNISPESLLEAGHPPGRTLQLLQQLGISPNRVVIELTEQTPSTTSTCSTPRCTTIAPWASPSPSTTSALATPACACGRNCVRLREDRPPLRRRHPPGHRETRVRRLHPEDGAGLSRPGHRRRHRTARGTRGT